MTLTFINLASTLKYCPYKNSSIYPDPITNQTVEATIVVGCQRVRFSPGRARLKVGVPARFRLTTSMQGEPPHTQPDPTETRSGAALKTQAGQLKAPQPWKEALQQGQPRPAISCRCIRLFGFQRPSKTKPAPTLVLYRVLAPSFFLEPSLTYR